LSHDVQWQSYPSPEEALRKCLINCCADFLTALINMALGADGTYNATNLQTCIGKNMEDMLYAQPSGMCNESKYANSKDSNYD
jgi:hypothetical protein